MANNTCPYCESKNCLQNIGILIDSGTSSTNTFGLTYNSEEGMTPGMYWSSTASGLAQRFAPPGIPGDITFWNFLGWWVLTTPIIGWIAFTSFFRDWNTWESSGSVWMTYIIFGIPVGMLFGLAASWSIQMLIFASKKELRRRYGWGYYYLRNATFCMRCGTAFDLWHSGSPEEFVSKKFDLSQYAQ